MRLIFGWKSEVLPSAVSRTHDSGTQLLWTFFRQCRSSCGSKISFLYSSTIVSKAWVWFALEIWGWKGLITWSMKGLKRFILKCSTIVSAVAFVVCLCFVVLRYQFCYGYFIFYRDGINDGKIHSASEATSKCLLAVSTWFYKITENNAFPDCKYAPHRHKNISNFN